MRRLVRTTAGWFVGEPGRWDRVPVDAIDHLADALAALSEHGDIAAAWPPGRLLPPVSPGKFILVGLNYRSHAEEMNLAIPAYPMFGEMPGDSVTAGDATVPRPDASPDQIDFEGEIAVIIGRGGQAIPAAAAGFHVLGLTACNDLTARDVQIAAIAAMRSGEPGPTIAQSKSFPGSKPLGPQVYLTDGLDLGTLDLPLETRVNGECRQTGNAAELIFSIPALVETVSAFVVLSAGDVICTGTPAGSGFSARRFLQAGDRIEIALGDLPALVTTIA